MPKYRMKLNNLHRDLVQRHSGIIQAPQLSRKLIDEVSQEILTQIEPKASWEIFPYHSKEAAIEGKAKVMLQGKKLPHRLCQCHHIVVLAICLGAELQNTIRNYMLQSSLLKAILMEDAGSAAINQVCSILVKRITESIKYENWELTERYLVGYGDGEISDAPKLLALVEGSSLGIKYGGEGMLYPRQTLVAVMGIYDKKQKDGKAGIATMPCQKCQEENCEFREQEYREPRESDWEEYMQQDTKFTIADLLKKKEK